MTAITISQSEFGRLPTGEPVTAVTLANSNGMAVRLLSYGATIQSVIVPDSLGRPGEVTFGHSELQTYLDHPQYAGSTVGRVANRIAGAQFVLDGTVYQLAANDGANSLHGGLCGFDKVNWQIGSIDADGVVFTHVSADGDEGYPGELRVCAAYRLDQANRLSVEYTARSDASTVVALTNHAYWNLAGAGSGRSAMDHRLMIPADHFLPVCEDLIPTGELRPVAGSLFDFCSPAVIADRVRAAGDEQIRFGRGFDHSWVMNECSPGSTRMIACLEDLVSGRVMSIDSNQRGIQFYSGNFFDGSVAGHGGWLARMGDYIALEPQALPDAANRPELGSVRLMPGETYRNIIGWTFDVLPRQK